MRAGRAPTGAGALALLLALAGCADSAPTPAPVATAASAPAKAAAAAAPAAGGIVLNPVAAAPGTPLANDPSAPTDTPLCGVAARETNAAGQSLLSRQYAEAGICSSFACYDPATATFIGADGYRHVCR